MDAPRDHPSSAGVQGPLGFLLTPAIYEELRALASAYVARAAGGDSVLQPTSLLHEAFLKIAQHDAAGFESEGHFRAVAAMAMRHLLIDHLRRKRSAKRGGGVSRVTLADHHALTCDGTLDLLTLDDLLRRFEALDPRAARVVELRFFAGSSDPAIAELLSVSERTVRSDWAMARAWIRAQLLGEDPLPGENGGPP